MAESVARRDRIDSQTSTSWYLWEAAGKPACAYFSFDLIDRLEREVVDNFRSLTSRGSEIGGILLGGIAGGTPSGISIEEYETVTCDYSRGPLYRLSDSDLARFEKVMQERSEGGNIQVVGFFRSHTRKGLALDPEDLAFLEARFRNPLSVALLVRPFATKASVAGLFLRGEKGFDAEPSALEFPFRSSQLTPSKRGGEPPAPAPTPVRAQVVPIAGRRETPSPVNAAPAAVPAPPVPPASPVVQPEAKAAVPPAPEAPKIDLDAAKPVQPAHGAVPVTKVAVPAPKNPSVPSKAAPAPKTDPAPPAAKSAAPAQPAPKAEAPKPAEPKPEPKVESKPVEQKAAAVAETLAPIEEQRASKIPMITGLVAAGLLGFVLLFVYPGFLHHPSKPAPTASQDSSPLTLRVEHSGTDLLLTWNRDSAAIRNATRASLAITDGARHENYDMDLAQLRTGSIVYSPLGGDVSFQMEVIGKDQSRTATETLRLLQTRPSPMPVEGQDSKGAKDANPPAGAPNSPSAQASGNSDSDPAEDQKPAEPVRTAPVKQFDASSLSQRLRPARPTELADLPSPAVAPAVVPKMNTDASLPFASMPAAPAPAAPAPSSQSRSASQPGASGSNSGGQIQAAQLIFRKEPDYPLLARQMGAKGTVELIATIGTDGAVKSVKVVKGHPLLAKAAQDAVMQWRYRPTLLNGQPVQNDTRITLNFVAQ